MQTIRLTVTGAQATAHGPIPFDFVRLLTKLSGKKLWRGSNACVFDATPNNMRLLRESNHTFDITDKTGEIKKQEVLEGLPTQHETRADPKIKYTPQLPYMKHQKHILNLSWDREAYAIFLDMGLGKTAVTIHNTGMLYVAKKIIGVIIVAPSGVHRQWIEDEYPKHLDKRIKTKTWVWKDDKDYAKGGIDKTRLNILAINVDAVRTNRGAKAIKEFIKDCGGKVLMAIDESQNIKTMSADRTKACIIAGHQCAYRRILTGTPIAKNLLDTFSQFYFLDPNILGHRYVSSFRARYCIMGGFQGRQVVGQQRVDEFYSLIAPHSYRLTKEEALNLPPKQYIIREYDMSDKTRAHYKKLKKELMTTLTDGSKVSVVNGLTAVLRLQQLICGYLPKDDNKELVTISDERLDVLDDIVDQRSGQIVIWCRFTEDIRRIAERYKDECVIYFGGNKGKKGKGGGEEAKRLFLEGKKRIWIGNAAAGGAGLNLQGGKRNTVVYYSNSHRSLDRWQSEDRNHRKGTEGTVTYFDIVARGTVDRGTLANLRGKRDIARLSLDDIRQLIAGENDNEPTQKKRARAAA